MAVRGTWIGRTLLLVLTVAVLAGLASGVGGAPGDRVAPLPFDVGDAVASPDGVLAMVAGASRVFLALEGIPGESTVSGHEAEIDVMSWSWGLADRGSLTNGADRRGGPRHGPIVITKGIDTSTPLLYRELVGQADGTDAVFEFTAADGATSSTYLVVALTDVRVTSVDTELLTGAGAAEPRPVDSVSLDFATMEVTYRPIGADGQPGAPVVFTYDTRTAS